MESKELNEILNKTRRTPDISLTPKQVKELVKDLEILEAIKNKAQNNRFFRGCLLRMFCETKKTPNGMKKEKVKDENYDKITRWLNNDK